MSLVWHPLQPWLGDFLTVTESRNRPIDSWDGINILPCHTSMAWQARTTMCDICGKCGRFLYCHAPMVTCPFTTRTFSQTIYCTFPRETNHSHFCVYNTWQTSLYFVSQNWSRNRLTRLSWQTSHCQRLMQQAVSFMLWRYTRCC